MPDDNDRSRKAVPERAPGPSGAVTRFFVQHRGAGWACMAAVLAWGCWAALTLPQQEDPTFPTHDAVLLTLCPGLDVREAEQNVTSILETAIANLPGVETLTSRTRPGLSAIVITLRAADKGTIAREWGSVRKAVADVALPEGCGAPELDTDYQLPATLLFALSSSKTGDGALSAMSDTAEMLAGKLRKLSTVGRVRITGAAVRERLLAPFAGALSQNNVSLDSIRTALRNEKGAMRRFPSEDDLLAVEVPKAGQTTVPLGEIASLGEVSAHRSVIVEALESGGGEQPARKPAVLLSVEMRRGGNIHEFNREVRGWLGSRQAALPAEITVTTISDQPSATARRIEQFARCFIEAMTVVVLVTILLMDWRTALVVAAAIPLTIAMTLGGMQLLGVPLQQISIAALIIALGMLVDDPVVAADGINRELAAGAPRAAAAWLGPYKLRRAIFFGTIINIAAFLPLALLPGDMGAFVISLPVVVTLALVASRLVSLTFVPLLGHLLLRGQRGFEQGGEVRSFPLLNPMDRALAHALPRYRALLEGTLRRPTRTMLFAFAMLALSFLLTPFFGKQFFPAAERNQMLVDIVLAEGSKLSETREVAGRVADILGSEAAIAHSTLVAGGGMPMFYYNLLPREPGQNVAQILINTRSPEDVPELLMRLRKRLDREITGARCIVKQLQQGPAMDAPIEVQITGDDQAELRTRGAEVAQILETAGAYKVHDDLGARVPTPTFTLKDAAKARGITAASIGRQAADALTGLTLAAVGNSGASVPVVARVPDSSPREADFWNDVILADSNGNPVRFEELARFSLNEDEPVISHINGRRSITVKAYPHFGELASRTLDRARPAIAKIPRSEGRDIVFAGEERELKNSQREMGKVLVVSLTLITLTMLIQFRSLVKALVVMLTVPLGLIGAFVGLATVHASFGFMALLGIVSLAGVIVSHIIVLSDFIEEERSAGVPLQQALVQAGLVRLRAVLATVFATVGGLVPLALSGGSLWQPLTSVHIFGLLFATLLTLVVLPVLYCFFCVRLKWIKWDAPKSS